MQLFHSQAGLQCARTRIGVACHFQRPHAWAILPLSLKDAIFTVGLPDGLMTNLSSLDPFNSVQQGDAAVSSDAYGLQPTRDGYRLARFFSGKGCNDVRCQGVYSQTAIGVVLAGAFEYKSGSQTGIAVPGSLIFANRSEEFHCRYLTEEGNRRLAIFLDDSILQSAGAHANSGRDIVPSLLAPSVDTTRALGAIARMVAGPPEDQLEDVFSLIETCFTADWDHRPGAGASEREIARVIAVVRYINDHFTDDCSLDRLAAIAAVSKFRFARTFREITGETIAQYVANKRLSAAATRLVSSAEPISNIALECGFNDISYFNARFRAAFGTPPSKWRAARGAYRSAVHSPG